MLELVLTEAFARVRRKITKAYQFSESDIDRAIDEITAAPDAHPVYPGFTPHTLRKCRVAMRAYKIPERKGLRLIYLVGKAALAPIHVYKKGHPPQEHMVVAEIKAQLREIIKELGHRRSG
jgi:hypothetical protein